MPASSLDEQITKYLTDAHSIEEQALAQMERAPGMAGDPDLGRDLRRAPRRDRASTSARSATSCERRGAEPSTVKDVAGKRRRLGHGPVRAPEPRHARQARRARVRLRAHGARRLRAAAPDGRARRRRARARRSRSGSARRSARWPIASPQRWDRAVDASLREKGADDLDKEVVKYLRDAHALEAPGHPAARAGPKIAGFHELAERLRGAPRADARAPAPRRRAPRAARQRARRASRPARCASAR